MSMTEEQRITICKTSTQRINTALSTSPSQAHLLIPLARQVTAHVDATTLLAQPSRTAESSWLTSSLQRLATLDADSGGVPDLAAWCSRSWLTILQREGLNVTALRGLGQIWLARAQPALARIHGSEGSGSSVGSGFAGSGNGGGNGDKRREKKAQEARLEAERRAGSPDYVEARGSVQPASEYLERAVRAAGAQRVLSGDLLATAAEAYMSLGIVSSPRVNEQHFRRALQLLRAAAAVPGYTLSAHLQQYLNDYGRLLEQ